MKIYNIPGWKNADVDHWQSIWEKNDPKTFERINQENWLFPEKDSWSTQIGNTLPNKTNYWVTCHSIGCAAFIHAFHIFKLTPKGAFFVAPSDPEQPNYPSEITGFAPVPFGKLPFPSIVVASDNDKSVSSERSKQFANAWGSTLIILENAGHIESKSGFGEWKEGRQLLEKLIKT